MLKEVKGGAGTPGSVTGGSGAGGDGHIKTKAGAMKEEGGAMKEEPGERVDQGIKEDPEGDAGPPQPLQNGQVEGGYNTGRRLVLRYIVTLVGTYVQVGPTSILP